MQERAIVPSSRPNGFTSTPALAISLPPIGIAKLQWDVARRIVVARQPLAPQAQENPARSGYRARSTLPLDDVAVQVIWNVLRGRQPRHYVPPQPEQIRYRYSPPTRPPVLNATVGAVIGESRWEISPPGAFRNVREPLGSYGSPCSAVDV
jgi:hypothetical protein